MKVARMMFLFLVVWMTLAGTALAIPASLPNRQGGIVQVGQDWTLPSGGRERGDVLIISADAVIQERAVLDGTLTVISGNAVIAGTVNGDVNVISGDVILRETGVVGGDVNIVSGKVNQAPGARVEGDIVRGNVRLGNLTWSAWFPAFFQGLGPWTFPGSGTLTGVAAILLELVFSFLRAFGISVGVAAIGAVLVLVWPEGIQRIAHTVEQAFLPSLGIGFLTWFAGGLIILLLVITICFAIIGVAGLVALIVLSLLGWTAIGRIVGERLWQAMGMEATSPLWPTVGGTFLITLLSRIPCVGTIFGLILGSVGLGATLVTLYTRYNERRALPAG